MNTTNATTGLFAITSVAILLAVAGVFDPAPVAACGGFACNGGGGPTPVVQAAERIIFEDRGDGNVRAYIQIQYSQQGAPVGFSWIVPVTSVPELGIADIDMFNELDSATSPQFRFVNNPSAGGGGGGGGGLTCGSSADSFRAGVPGSEADDGVTIWDTSRVGDYETAVISGESGDAIRTWLVDHDYDVTTRMAELLDGYVYTGHLFAAFRYSPLDGLSGALDPITLTYAGEKPCVPIKLTAIASTPILDISVIAFGAGRTHPDPAGEYVEVVPDYANIGFDFSAPTQTSYTDEVDAALDEAGGHGWVVEHAGASQDLGGLAHPDAVAIAQRNPYVTRFYTRMTPEMMDVDPEFVVSAQVEDVNRLHVIDLGGTRASLVSGRDSGLRFAAPPFALAIFAVFLRRRRR